jgi:putative hemolysin
MNDSPPPGEAPRPLFFDVAAALSGSEATRHLAPMAGPISHLLSLDRINAAYDEVMALSAEEGSFFKGCLRRLSATYEVSAVDLQRFPQDGPVVVACNHPFGALDGLILGAILEDIRPDFRILGNLVLSRITPIAPWIIEVNPFDSAKGTLGNARGLRAALSWLKEGKVLGMFPAGEVSRYRFRDQAVRDPLWSHHAVSLARRTGAAIVPFFIQGRNSLVFQSLGAVHPLLRTLMLPRELVNKEGHHVPILVGQPILPRELDRIEDDERRTRYVRLRTELLSQRGNAPGSESKLFHFPARPPAQEPVAESITSETLANDIQSLPPAALFFSHKQFDAYLTSASQIPNVLLEIGRLRELCFRKVGEGSGKARDIDRFDAIYEHLFLWDRNAQAIAGAYRVARTDLILRDHGPSGLYTSTLFRFSDRFLEELTPGLECGRSFVSLGYQRAQLPLLLLWRGVTGIAGRDPRYHRLFGPVSISNTYSQASKWLMTQYLQQGRESDLLRLASQVRPRRPFRKQRIFGVEPNQVSDLLNGVEDVSALISAIEPDGKGIPVLLKHYFKMHTTLLSFNVDRDFSNCLDGLIITDLYRTDRAFLKKIMFPEGIAALDAFGRDGRAG